MSPRLVERLRDYMIKAIKEAKIHTSWINDSQAYDEGTARFVERVLTGASSRRFLASFLPFQARVARLAVANSLAQVVLKAGSPGVPDFYQGTELWDLHLVDPDNRQPVDFTKRRELLEAMEGLLPDAAAAGGPADGSNERLSLLAEMLDNWGDGRIKMWVTAAALRARRARPELFLGAEYVKLEPAGRAAAHLFAFVRRPVTPAGADASVGAALVVVPRIVSRLGDTWRDWTGAWGETSIPLPPDLARLEWSNVITGERVASSGGSVMVSGLLSHCPVALLTGSQ